MQLWSRLTRDALFPILVPLLAVAAALAVGAIFIVALGADLGAVYGKLISGAVGNTYSQTQTIGQATPLLFVALGVLLALRAHVLNIGVEGPGMIGGVCGGASSSELQRVSQ